MVRSVGPVLVGCGVLSMVFGCPGAAIDEATAGSSTDSTESSGTDSPPADSSSTSVVSAEDSCTPIPCEVQGFDCGLGPDGCGGEVDCGECVGPQVCGGGGVDNVCGTTCTPSSCADQGFDCGLAPDGCGEQLDCGECVEPQVCGGGGVDNVCGEPCTAVRTIFFDLGETLVEPIGDGMFADRPGAVDLLADLQALSMPIGLITNTPAGWDEMDLRAVLVNPDLLDEFEVVLLSSQAVSSPKPSPEIFEEAYGMLSSPPPIEQVAFVTEELGHIADLPRAPTEGAKAAGMLGVHLSDGDPSPLADFTVSSGDLNAIAQLAETEWLRCER